MTYSGRGSRRSFRKQATAAVLIGALLPGGASAQDVVPSAEEMWRIIQAQQKQIEALMGRLEETDKKVEATEQKVEETDEKVEAAGDMI
jgi:outer membrane murein-binding lipoprotein Lpp